MDQMAYLRLRAAVLREAAESITHCAFSSHANVVEQAVHVELVRKASLLNRIADASEEAADALEELASKPTPGFWPSFAEYQRAMDHARLLREAEVTEPSLDSTAIQG